MVARTLPGLAASGTGTALDRLLAEAARTAALVDASPPPPLVFNRPPNGMQCSFLMGPFSNTASELRNYLIT